MSKDLLLHITVQSCVNQPFSCLTRESEKPTYPYILIPWGICKCKSLWNTEMGKVPIHQSPVIEKADLKLGIWFQNAVVHYVKELHQFSLLQMLTFTQNDTWTLSYTLEPTFKIHFWDKNFIPSTLEDFKRGLCQSQTENYYHGYRNIIFTLNLNLMLLFFNPFYLYMIYLFYGR